MPRIKLLSTSGGLCDFPPLPRLRALLSANLGGMNEQIIEVSMLRSALNRVLDAVVAEHGESVKVPHDHYWHLPAHSAFEMTAEPSMLTVGQVTDDVAETAAYLQQERDEDGAAVWHDLQHVIGLLRAIERVSTP